MGQTLRRSSISKILLFTAFLVGIAFQGGYSQTTLSPGDLMIVTVNADGNEDGNKTFDFVPLTDLEKDTEIKFTDAAYIESENSLDDGEGTITYTAPTEVSAGEVVSYNGQDDDETNGFLKEGNFNPSTVGDNILVYQGDVTDPTFIFGVGWAKGSSVWDYNPDSSPTNRSDIPSELSQADNTILSLGTTDNYQYDASNGIKGTAKTLSALVGDESNWNEDDDNPFSVFSTDFTLVDPPTVAFIESALTASEDDDTVDLTVELVEADETAVDVELTFLEGSSTATNGDDFENFSTETVSFDDQASTGDTKTVSVNITNDGDFEGSEKAVFQLQNNTEGTIVAPQELTLTIEDNDAPKIVINEIHADPDAENGDADGNGEVNSRDDEFIEFVNNTSSELDISGWTVSDASDLRHTFPDGTVISADQALVLFGDNSVSPEGNFGGAVIQSSNESAELSLNNSEDTIKLADEDGNVIVEVTYGSEGGDDQSLTRDSDISGSFVKHSDATDSGGSLFSPGTKADGTPFGSKFAIGIRGTEGWRMISSPVQDATFDDFFGDFWMQGMTGSDDPSGDVTLMTWDETEGSFISVDDVDDEFIPGKGYIAYFFEDDDFSTPGIQGGFPKVVSTDKTENGEDEADPAISVSTTDLNDNGKIDNDNESIEGWNLLGNPFGTDISVAALIDVFEDADNSVQSNIQVWDHKAGGGQGGFVALGDGDKLAPFQAFFVKFTEVDVEADVTFDRDELTANSGADFFKTNTIEKAVVDLELHGEEFYDTYSLEFSENGTTDLDRYDVYKLFSLNPNSINLFSEHDDNRLQKKSLPIDLESALEVPLAFEANGRSKLTFQWNNEFQDIPSEWDLILIDEESGREIDLRRDEEYSFNVEDSGDQQKASASDDNELLNKSKGSQEPRFTLSVQPNTKKTASNNLPESVKLKPNYPNPFNPTTTIPYELTEESDVLLTVWNMIGQKVATLVDGTVEAGTHEVSWNASDMPSGMYIARFEVNGTVFTRKMTLIK